MSTKHKGWGSYETWLLNESCTSDESCVAHWRFAAMLHLSAANRKRPNDPEQAYHLAVLAMASDMAQTYANAPRIAYLPSPWHELIMLGLKKVFWSEIAEAWLAGVEDSDENLDEI